MLAIQLMPNTTTVYIYTGADQTRQTVHSGLSVNGTTLQTTSYTYDAMGRMTGVSVAKGGTTTSVSYAYDAGGYRVEQVTGGVRTVYLMDPDNPTGYSQTLEEGVDANNNHRLDAGEVQKAYTLGQSVLTQATATQVLHLLTDAHGNVIAALNANVAPNPSAVVERYVYTAYGMDLGLPASPLTNIRYAGQYIDSISGLSFNRARWYDPASGRFLTLDPFGGNAESPISFNKYLFGSGNPVNRMDPNPPPPHPRALIRKNQISYHSRPQRDRGSFPGGGF